MTIESNQSKVISSYTRRRFLYQSFSLPKYHYLRLRRIQLSNHIKSQVPANYDFILCYDNRGVRPFIILLLSITSVLLLNGFTSDWTLAPVQPECQLMIYSCVDTVTSSLITYGITISFCLNSNFEADSF